VITFDAPRLLAMRPEEEAAWLRSLAAELSAGATLRAALAAAAVDVPRLERVVRLAAGGSPLEEVAGHVAAALPTAGPSAAAAIDIVARSGGRAAAVFAELAAQADAKAELAAERRAATAQARLSATVVGALPLGALAMLLVSGRAAALLGGGGVGSLILIAGIGLQVLGLAAVVAMVRRAAR
jgi:Flp pilus assembly protein TadB